MEIGTKYVDGEGLQEVEFAFTLNMHKENSQCAVGCF